MTMSEKVVGMLLEAGAPLSFDDIKHLALTGSLPSFDYYLNYATAERPKFNIGFAVRTSNQSMIEDNAEDRGVALDWDAINAVKVLGSAGIACHPEGHGDDELVGSATVVLGEPGFDIVRDYAEYDEPYSTTSGTIMNIPGMDRGLYAGVDPEVAGLLDVDIEFFSLEEISALKESADEVDPKSMAMAIGFPDVPTGFRLKRRETKDSASTFTYDLLTRYAIAGSIYGEGVGHMWTAREGMGWEAQNRGRMAHFSTLADAAECLAMWWLENNEVNT